MTMDSMIKYIGTGETATPMSPFTPDQFKYSFTVKYIELLRQVFSPFQSLNYAFENLLQWVYRATRLRCRLNSELRRGMVT